MGTVQIGTIPCMLEWPAMAAAYGMNMLYLTLSNLFNLFNHLISKFLCVCFTGHLIEIQTDTYVKFKGCPTHTYWLRTRK